MPRSLNEQVYIKTSIFFIYLVSIVSVFALHSVSAGENKVLMPYISEPPEINLNKEEQRSLNNKPIFKTLMTQNGEQKAIVFKVDASPEKIWTTIKNYPQYKNWLKNVKESEVYKTEEDNVYVRFRIKHWALGEYQYFIKHTFSNSNENWATWTLDENQQSDFLSSVGFWRVYEVEGRSAQSYVTYSADLLFKNKKPTYLRNRIINSGLKKASIWVKKNTEN